MPRFVSKDGKWYPAKEHAVLPHLAGTDKEVYDGPDRAALFVLFQEKVDHLGQDFRHDIELINRVRQLGYKDVNAYAKADGYDKEKAHKELEEKGEVVSKHEIEEKVKGVEVLGGGKDFSGQGNDKYGGFGKPKE